MWSPRVTGRVSSRRAHSCAGTSTILVLLRWGLNSTDYHSPFRNSSTVWTIPDSSLQQTASRVTRNLVADLSRILLTTTLTGIWGMDLGKACFFSNWTGEWDNDIVCWNFWPYTWPNLKYSIDTVLYLKYILDSIYSDKKKKKKTGAKLYI